MGSMAAAKKIDHYTYQCEIINGLSVGKIYVPEIVCSISLVCWSVDLQGMASLSACIAKTTAISSPDK